MSKKTLAIAIILILVAGGVFLYFFLKRKKPSIEFEKMSIDEFGDKKALILPQDMTVGEIIKECSSVSKKTAFTIEWFCSHNPDFKTATAETVIPAGETVYYPV